MLAAIRAARATICLETYIFRHDFVGEAFAGALIERARAGVEVNILYDAWGSGELAASFLARLREYGIRAHPFHPLTLPAFFKHWFSRMWLRDHRKILTIDGRLGFVGGMNIAADYAASKDGGGGWRDTNLSVAGPLVVEMEQLFLRIWRRQHAEIVNAVRYAQPEPVKDPHVLLVSSDSLFKRWGIRRAYLRAINHAQKRIWLTHGYFIPTLKTRWALMRAARRGVDVRIILGGTTDVKVVLYAARALYTRWLRAGIRIFEWNQRVLHAKTAVVDGAIATVGSANLDFRSSLINLEANVFVDDAAFGAAMEKLFVADTTECTEVSLAFCRARPWRRRLLYFIAYLFRNWL